VGWLKTRLRTGGQSTDTPSYGEVCHAAAEALFRVAEADRMLTWREVAIVGGVWDGKTDPRRDWPRAKMIWAMGVRLAVQKFCLDTGRPFPHRQHPKRGSE
jgi:hypothetical protein